MKKVPLADEALDVAVFSLSLMGKNWSEDCSCNCEHFFPTYFHTSAISPQLKLIPACAACGAMLTKLTPNPPAIRAPIIAVT
jgi:hypothetical protein